MIPLHTRVDRANRRVYIEAATRSGGRISSEGDLTLVIGSHPSPIIANVIFRDPDAPTSALAPSTLGRALDRFTELGHRVSLLTTRGPDDDLGSVATALGWRPAIDLASMVTTKPITLPDRVELARTSWLDPIADLARFRDVITAGFAHEDDERGMVRAIFALPESLEAPVLSTIASHDGADAAGGLTYRFPDVAVVGWVATLPAFRGKGLGSSVTTALTNQAFADGADIVCLESSPMGVSVYEHLGFERVGLDRVWFPPSAEPR